MAAATIDEKPAIVACGTSTSILTLNPQREYTIQHLGKDVSAVASTGDIYGAIAADPTATYAADTNKAVLQDGKSIIVGPGVGDYRLKTASGSPCVMVVPGPHLHGAF